MSDDLTGLDEIKEIRRKKLKSWNIDYTFKPTTKLIEIKNLDEGQDAKIAGRVVFKRDIGGIMFFKLRDFNGTAQFALSKSILGEQFHFYRDRIDIGDILGISGEIFTTKAGEKTVQAKSVSLLSKAIVPLPEKWSGLKDEEQKLRFRYIDMVQDMEVVDKMKARIKLIDSIKSFLKKNDFLEVETPILQPIASGAAANPFVTHHDALDLKMYLRIAPELYLKRLVVGGINRVFEIGKCFRNEGIDPTHLQEFTMLEFYMAYTTYEEGQDFAIEILKEIAKTFSPDLIVNGFDFNFIEKISYSDLLLKYAGVKPENFFDEASLRKIATNHGLDHSDCKSRYAVLELIYKKMCVHKIDQPTLVFDYPRSPLAKISDKNKDLADQFQVILRKQEVVKSYIELADPEIQLNNFREQAKMLREGEQDSVREDIDFVKALEYGLPPTLGLGMGIDRLITILTNSFNLRDCIFFPTVKPNNEDL